MAGPLDAARPNPIGTYLRARRALVPPEAVGLHPSPRRRAAGLTREELAVLAGVSAAYYTRLEQGKDRHPSRQILQALATALRLDPEATAFLFALASDRDDGGATTPERVPQSVLDLLSTWSSTPSFVLGRFGAVLAAAPAVGELTPACRPGVNMFREIFLDPESQQRYVRWHAFTEVLAAGLRASVGRDVDAPPLVALVAELERESPRFRALWRRQDAAPASGGSTVVRHPVEGLIELRVQTLSLPREQLSLVVYHARPGSRDEAALARVVAATGGR